MVMIVARAKVGQASAKNGSSLATSSSPPTHGNASRQGVLSIFAWACSNCSFYRKVFQDRAYLRPV
jgi:hypothetical protein